ncbi:hypothetical protein GGF46_001005 [Coemansia sp. RSA 552]|nr:hypothetical protein GGF46_001005 [Coemansia sp. RSA 552]
MTEGGCCHHGPGPQAPSLASKRSTSHVFHEVYGPVPPPDQTPGGRRRGVSWRRMWSAVMKEHRFLGGQLYMAILHLCVGVVLWMAGIHVGSLALMCYAFIVIYDAWSLFIALMPRLLEYSGNSMSSVDYPFGLELLPTLLEFANNITLLYRSVQALKEGIEHIVISGHEHSPTSGIEFETYARGRSQGHNNSAALGLACVLVAMAVTGVSAGKFSNHLGMWGAHSVRRRQQQYRTGLQNAVLNPYNVSSLLAGLWMIVMLILAPASEESAIEPLSCILVAGLMVFVSFPTSLRLGKALLLAVPADMADGSQAVAWQVSRLPGVVDCTKYQVWSAAHDRYSAALRVAVGTELQGCESDVLHRHIASLLRSSGLGDWSIEIRVA